MSNFDINSLRMGEVREIERLAKQPFTALSDEGAPKADLFMALAYTARRREDKTFSWNDAEALTLAEVMEIVGESDEDEGPKA